MAGTLKYLRSDHYNRILNVLANKFAGEHQDTINIARNTLTDISAVTFESRADHTWDSILSLADEQDKIMLLLDNAIAAVGGSVELDTLKVELTGIKESLSFTTIQQVEIPAVAHDLPEILMIYSDDDAQECNELKKQFKVLERAELAVLRDFQSIASGNKKEQEEKLLANACIVLFILSPGFFAGEHINHARQLAGKDKIMIPVLLKNCLWQRVKLLAGRLPIPRDGAFISEYTNKEKGYAEVAEAVSLILDQNICT